MEYRLDHATSEATVKFIVGLGTIRNLIGNSKKIKPDCRDGVRAQLERIKELCKERDNLYEKLNDLKGQK